MERRRHCQVFGAPGLVRAAYTDPVEELRRASPFIEKPGSPGPGG